MTTHKLMLCFLDETGTLNINNIKQQYWGLGLIAHPSPDDLVCSLHQCHEGLCSLLKKDPSRLEFHFKEVTKTSESLYLNCLNYLRKDKHWKFFYLIINLNNPNFIKPLNAQQEWEYYLRWTKWLLTRSLSINDNIGFLLADYYRRPNGKTSSLADLPAILPEVIDTLQVQSQGVLLVQMADLLLGGSIYEGKDKVKLNISKRVKLIKVELGKSRFRRWNVKLK